MKITENKFVTLEYELYVDGETDGEQELMEKTTTFKPLEFIYGVGMMLPKFEQAIFGLAAGDKFEVNVDNADAYGPFDDENIVELDRSIFEQNGSLDENEIFPGNVVPMLDAEGYTHQGQILEVGRTKIKVDFNHPLAGENLYFKGKIIDVREPTNEEFAQFFHSCDCGCDDEDCNCCSERAED
jgi:FKBP-type peptidyl-prolyl cis-trans isomerase SlyD